MYITNTVQYIHTTKKNHSLKFFIKQTVPQ